MITKYQVFISSTFEDLRNERERLQWEILRAGYIPVGMESFAASNDRGWSTIQRTIDLSDYYVLVVAGRYGSVDPKFNLSWTEREYDYAWEQRMPTLVFMQEDDAVPPAKREATGPLQQRLAEFKEKVVSRHHYSRWSDQASLEGAVLRGLAAEMSAAPRPGWSRGANIVRPEAPCLMYYHVHLKVEGGRADWENGQCRVAYVGSGVFDSPDVGERYVDRARGANRIEKPNFRPEAQVINEREHERTGTYLEYQISGGKPLHICGELKTTVELRESRGGLALHIPYFALHVTFVVDLSACETLPTAPVRAWAVTRDERGLAVRRSLGEMHQTRDGRTWFATAVRMAAESNIEVSWGD